MEIRFRPVHTTPWSTRRIVAVGVVAGAAGGMAMAAVLMGYGGLSESRSVWGAPMAIWSWLFGLEHFGDPANHVGPIVLGMAAHLVNSMLVGVAFSAFASGFGRRNWLAPVVLGFLYALALWALMRYGVLPLNEATDALFTTSRVAPQWVWWLAHGALGIVTGAFFHPARAATFRGSAATPRGIAPVRARTHETAPRTRW